ncbi:MAG: hypothetical protein AAF664_05985 [Planctomycetota bacterium]
MGRKKAGEVSKSQAIRDHKKANPNQKPKQIAQELGKKGISVTPGFVSTILSTSKRSKGTRRRGRPAGSTNRTSKKTTTSRRVKTTSSDATTQYSDLLAMKATVKELGGIEQARTALAALEELMN